MSERTITDADSGETHALPTDVKEQSAAKTSVYEAGKLIYDGATGEGSRPFVGAPRGPRGSASATGSRRFVGSAMPDRWPP